ncbi:MAG: hypothetical protein LBT50_10120 [Prevotellaceae bacterium]|jgi:hypothetical protein|nr:hypothetical protein [Prevotellaceae bacterium]
MKALNVEIVNPKAKTLLENMESIGLIRINPDIYDELQGSLSMSSNRRQIGILEGKAFFKEVGDAKITENEFLGL